MSALAVGQRVYRTNQSRIGPVAQVVDDNVRVQWLGTSAFVQSSGRLHCFWRDGRQDAIYSAHHIGANTSRFVNVTKLSAVYVCMDAWDDRNRTLQLPQYVASINDSACEAR
jgi:hypothetical protein